MMKRNYPIIAALCLIAVAIVACSSNRKQSATDTETPEVIPATVVVPAFNADSACPLSTPTVPTATSRSRWTSARVCLIPTPTGLVVIT